MVKQQSALLQSLSQKVKNPWKYVKNIQNYIDYVELLYPVKNHELKVNM